MRVRGPGQSRQPQPHTDRIPTEGGTMRIRTIIAAAAAPLAIGGVLLTATAAPALASQARAVSK